MGLGPQEVLSLADPPIYKIPSGHLGKLFPSNYRGIARRNPA